jgi:hypothetical protein
MGNTFSIGEFEEDTLIGPSEGALVIVGGTMRDSTIALTFIELAGGSTFNPSSSIDDKS